MITCIADNIVSPLGRTTEENLQAVLAGQSMLRLHEHVFAGVEPFCASLFEERPSFAALCIESAERALAQTAVDASAAEVVFVISTTKGDHQDLITPAQQIAQHFHNPNQPIVVSNACISGVSAEIVAARLLESNVCRTCVVIGCDVQTQFIVSGFQSFKALSQQPCRPFDKDRVGLNLGEAAATMVLQQADTDGWHLLAGAMHNDANHISGPSRTGEGSYRCLKDVLGDTPVACVSVHGTATAYNDEMESIALSRAGMSEVPLSALKGYFGHTMGAAGVLETILTMHAADQGVVLASRGYQEQGTSCPTGIANKVRYVPQTDIVKLLSGFGGCNAAVRWTKRAAETLSGNAATQLKTLAELTLTAKDDLTALYREQVGNYPKFFKMDPLSRLGFIGTELLVKQMAEPLSENSHVIFANRSASIANDRLYEQTICDPSNYFPSPAVFVYTLPNIVTGEIAIRHHLYGETMSYVMDSENEWWRLVPALLPEGRSIVAWAECTSKTDYYLHMRLIEKR